MRWFYIGLEWAGWTLLAHFLVQAMVWPIGLGMTLAESGHYDIIDVANVSLISFGIVQVICLVLVIFAVMLED